MKRLPVKTLYYSDPLRDDFAGNNIETKQLPKDFVYVHRSVLWRALSAFLYYGFAVPVACVASRFIMGVRYRNRRAIRKLGKKGVYVYGNHTRELDVFIGGYGVFPKRNYVVANPDAVSIKGIRNLVMMLGALPVPTDIHTTKRFVDAVGCRIRQGQSVLIYPEAHIWPFYTGVRPFPDTSMRYPASDGAPCVVMTAVYRRRTGLFRFMKKPGMTVTFSDPLYADASLPPKEARRDLRDRIYSIMKETLEASPQPEYYRYEYRAPEEGGADSSGDRR